MLRISPVKEKQARNNSHNRLTPIPMPNKVAVNKYKVLEQSKHSSIINNNTIPNSPTNLTIS